jgi:Bacterial archaeo-eukaryotic release factor family 11
MLHIDLPTRADLETLVAHRAAPAVSIYVRTTPLTQDTAVDRIELKNLLKAAVAEMEAGDVPKRSIWPIEQAVDALIDDDGFWAVQANSLAIFATPERIRTFRLPNKLTSMVEVSDRFHLKPLIRSVTFPHNAYVLAIGMGAVRLIEVDADLPPQDVKVPNLPKDMASALGRRSHVTSTGEGRSGEQTSEHAMMSRYARTVDQALRPVLAGDGRPLIVAAAEPMASIYRAVSTYPQTAAQVIPGSADHTPDHQLAAAAREVLDRVYADDIAELAGLFATREAQGRATSDVAQAARAATYGAVDTLVVDMDAVVTGTVDDEDGSVAFSEGADTGTYGVVDEIARRTLQAGGRVVSARRQDVPGGGDLAAILRYAI